VASYELTPELRQQLAEALEQERDRLRRSMRQLAEAERALGQSQAEESDAGEEPADVASDLVEQEIQTTLERGERERLLEVEAALTRLEEGTYGRCESCGVAIDVERLLARPWARYCRRCAERRRQRGPLPLGQI